MIISVPLLAGPDQDLEKGKIIETVTCTADAQESYALYLPTPYSKDKKWPILFAFEPGARTQIPLQLFQKAAEKYHYIIVCPTNVKNGPWEPIIKAIKAVWQDTTSRFSIDYARVYAAGFSGGARAASLFPRVVGAPLAGIIACGAGLARGIKPEQLKPTYYHGIVGLEDFNYKEFVTLGEQMEQAAAAHTIEVIDGPHRWPPEEVCTRAVEWLELEAMKRGTRAKEEGLVAAIYERALERGRSLEESGMIYHAAAFYKYAAARFKGLKDIAELEENAARVLATPQYRQFADEEKRRNIRERESIGRFAFVFSLVRSSDPAKLKLKKILADLGLADLLKEAGDGNSIYDRAMARRLLLELRIKGAREGANHLEKGNYERAALFYEVAAGAGSENWYTYYSLACAYSLSKNKKEALKNLQLAVEKGFTDISLIEKEHRFDFLRNEKKFQDILRSIGKK